MTNRLEDSIGKILMVATFLALATLQTRSIATTIELRNEIDLWPFVLSARIAAMMFLCLVVFLTVVRHAPKNVSTGIEPRITSIAGTFCLMFLVVLPTGEPGLAVRALASSLVVIGTGLSIWCAIYLGRSFSIMAAARKLVVHGPYALVRHPLYAAEGVAALGAVMANWSIPACLLFVAWCGLQYRRMLHEERILRETFPEYDDYARHVSRVIPSLTPYQPRTA